MRRLRTLALGLSLLGGALVAANAPITEGRGQKAPLEAVLAEPGRSLRAAVDALGRGESELADSLLRAVSERHPIVADHADLLRMRLRVESGDAEGAVAFEPRWRQRDSWLRGRFYSLLGEAHLARGDEKPARAAWELAALATKDRAQLAGIELDIARSYLRSGDRERAGQRLIEVWTRYAELPEADTADTLLAELEPDLGRVLRTAGRTRERGDQLYERYHNEAALAAYDRALALGVSGGARTRASHQRAETLFRLRRYPEAIEAYDALPASEERLVQRARAQARTGQVTAGAKALEELGERRGSQAVYAQYLAALLWDGEGEHARARRLFESVARRAPNSKSAASSRWFLGWVAFRAGRYAEAAQHFERLAAREKDPVSAMRPRYWEVRALEEQGVEDTARRYAELAREYPFTYYGWRALERVGARAESRREPAVWPGRRSLSAADLARPEILLEAGLTDEAREELAQLFRRAKGVDDRIALASLYADAGDFNRAQRLVVNAYNERLARGPAPDHVELWWHAWPAPYEHELHRAARPGAPSPELVYSIMREESGYRPEVISVSGARGLLQLMPTTATRVAQSVSLEGFDPADLFRPEVNIELGSAYLGQLLARFGGNTPAAIGSYNAGPEAVSRWLKSGVDTDDVWVEEIPYTQTRAYVKRVLRSLHVYRVLY
jgi:soluble lytic murein transglycosylase